MLIEAQKPSATKEQQVAAFWTAIVAAILLVVVGIPAVLFLLWLAYELLTATF